MQSTGKKHPWPSIFTEGHIEGHVNIEGHETSQLKKKLFLGLLIIWLLHDTTFIKQFKEDLVSKANQLTCALVHVLQLTQTSSRDLYWLIVNWDHKETRTQNLWKWNCYCNITWQKKKFFLPKKNLRSIRPFSWLQALTVLLEILFMYQGFKYFEIETMALLNTILIRLNENANIFIQPE